MTVLDVRPSTVAAAPGPVEPSAPSAFRVAHRPALDGVRGLAVLVVVAFHAGFGWAQGGYLGVSTFFTLSGFLIATLALAEKGRTGRMDLRGFWVRRARRLLPAAVAGIALAVVLVAVLGAPGDQRAVSGDALSGLGYAANWHQLLSGQSYLDLFREPGPLVHLWSLAVEEQFYLVFPFVAVAAFARTRSFGQARRRLGAAAAAIVAMSVALPLVRGMGFDRVYYGTDTRAAEIAVGVLLACLVAPAMVGNGRLPVASTPAARRMVAAVAAVALTVMAVAWVAVPNTSPLLVHGGLLGYALLSTVVVLAAALGTGGVARLLANPVLRHLGLVSYGLYLYHWPVFWALKATWHLEPTALFVVGGGLSLALAELSRMVLEDPVRRARGRLGRRPLALAPLAVAVVVLAVSVARVAPTPPIDFEAASATAARLLADPAASPDGVAAADPGALVPAGAAAATPAGVPDPTGIGAPLPGTTIVPPAAPPAAPRRIAFYGDSTAMMSALGVGYEREQLTGLVPVRGYPELGCALIRSTKRKYHFGKVESRRDTCNHWERVWPERVAQDRADVLVLQVGPWEAFDFQRPGGDGWEHLGMPAFDDYARSELDAAIDVLAAGGARVVLATVPPLHPDDVTNHDLCSCPDRIDRFNQIQAEVAAARPDVVTLVDFAGWLASTGRDAELRVDGVHLSPNDSAATAAVEFWGPTLAAVPLRA